jgi:hypothetical protein
MVLNIDYPQALFKTFAVLAKENGWPRGRCFSLAGTKEIKNFEISTFYF